MKKPLLSHSAFTLLEVMLALAILAISLITFIAVIGDGLKSIAKANTKISALELAEEKVNAVLVGQLGPPAQKKQGKISWHGVTDQGQIWTVEAVPWPEEKNHALTSICTASWLQFKVQVAGVQLYTIGPNPLKNEQK